MAFTVAEVNEEVRFKLGGLSQAVMGDTTMDKIIQVNVDDHSLEDSDFCIVTYESIIDVLRYLILQDGMNSGSTGVETKRREKNSRQEIEIDYSESTKVGYQKVLDDYLSHPEWVCKSLVSLFSGDSGVLIGGVSQEEYDRVQDDTDSRNAYQTSVSKQYDCKTTKNIRRRTQPAQWPF